MDALVTIATLETWAVIGVLFATIALKLASGAINTQGLLAHKPCDRTLMPILVLVAGTSRP